MGIPLNAWNELSVSEVHPPNRWLREYSTRADDCHTPPSQLHKMLKQYLKNRNWQSIVHFGAFLDISWCAACWHVDAAAALWRLVFVQFWSALACAPFTSCINHHQHTTHLTHIDAPARQRSNISTKDVSVIQPFSIANQKLSGCHCLLEQEIGGHRSPPPLPLHCHQNRTTEETKKKITNETKA